jgi:hypothetical protein
MIDINIFRELVEVVKKTNGFLCYIDDDGKIYVTNIMFSSLCTLPNIDNRLMDDLKELHGCVFNIPNMYKLLTTEPSVNIRAEESVGYIINNLHVIYDRQHNPHHHKFNNLIKATLPEGSSKVIPNFNIDEQYLEYQGINAAYGKFEIYTPDSLFIVYKNFVPTNKSDKVDLEIFNKGEYSTAIFTIYKPKGLIVKCAINFYNI